jgi:site-specific recombinase XerD
MNDVLTATLKAIRMDATIDGVVFCNRNGTPYKSFRSAFERAVQKGGLIDFTFHDLRHTFASRLVMSGVDLPTVKELLGHKDISMTLRYTHLSSGPQAARRAFTRAVWGRSPSNFHNRDPGTFQRAATSP